MRVLSALFALTGACLFPCASCAQEQRLVYSVGDLHGDFVRFQRILHGLELAEFDGEEATWTGGSAILVSTGDIVDRGEHSRPIYLAFMALAQQAQKQGGEVVNILGNHDLMNLQGDLRYVAAEELASDGDYGGEEARRQDFSPEGLIGHDVRTRYVVAAVREGLLFVHAGLHPFWIRNETLEDMNGRVRELIAGPSVSQIEPILSAGGPMWDRTFAKGEESECCHLAGETLRLVSAERMVLGHSIQTEGVTARCVSAKGPLVVLADTAISRAYGDCGVPSAVEYRGGNITAIYFDDSNETSLSERVPIFVKKKPASVLLSSRLDDALFGGLKFIERTTMQYEVQGQSTYWSEDDSVYLFRISCDDTWALAFKSSFAQNLDGSKMCDAHSEPNLDISGAPHFIRMQDDTSRRLFSSVEDVDVQKGGSACVNFPVWRDCVGNDCSVYEANPDWCEKYGDTCAKCGRTAQDACCICKAQHERQAMPDQGMGKAEDTSKVAFGRATAEEVRQSEQILEKRLLGLSALAADESKIVPAKSPTACSEYQACAHLAGECCPSAEGVVLACCRHPVVPQEAEPARAQRAAAGPMRAVRPWPFDVFPLIGLAGPAARPAYLPVFN